MRHDQLFKKLLEKFLRDFLELFFPDVAARLDFGIVQFLDKELPMDFPRGTTRERRRPGSAPRAFVTRAQVDPDRPAPRKPARGRSARRFPL